MKLEIGSLQTKTIVKIVTTLGLHVDQLVTRLTRTRQEFWSPLILQIKNRILQIKKYVAVMPILNKSQQNVTNNHK